MTAAGAGARAVLAIDAGQTGTKVRVARAGTVAIDTVLPGVRTDESLLPQLAATVEQVIGRLDSGAASQGAWPIDAVAAGVSGLTRADADPDALLGALHPLGVRLVLLAHDSVTSFLGTLGDARGAVVAAGTGVVTMAVGRTSVSRVDGWGNIMGDAGSAYWIGRAALEAGMRAYDGRAPATRLLDLIAARWPDVEAAYMELQGDPDRVRVVASLAEEVSALAEVDAAAARICRDAGGELAASVVAALTRVGETSASAAPRVGATGGVLVSPLIRSTFEHVVRRAVPNAVITAPRGNGLDGAAALPALAEAHPLRALVAVAAAAERQATA